MINEQEIIDKYFNRSCNVNRNGVILGIGDDCAIIHANKKYSIVVSTDTLVSGIHFLPNINPSDLVYKSLIVNLSDIAAMGANPNYILLSLTLPSVNEVWLNDFSNSLFKYLKYHNIQLIGGDINKGQLSITISICGIIPFGKALTRNGAKAGDLIYVTGTLGDSATGLLILKNKLNIDNTENRNYLISRHLRPESRVIYGQNLISVASSSIDVSDGIISDLNKILKSSKCGALINLNKIPISDALSNSLDMRDALKLAINGGEDYELCFTVPRKNLKKLKTSLNFLKYTCIGEITSYKEGIKFLLDDKIIDYKWNGYDHFKKMKY